MYTCEKCNERFVGRKANKNRFCSRACLYSLFSKMSLSKESNGMWKGVKASYSAHHHWINYHSDKQGKCSECGQSRYTEWANISGKYFREVDDYKELCKPCHYRYDKIGEKVSKAWALKRQIV